MTLTPRARRNGFTVLELLVVLIMIGIIVVIAMPRARAVRDAANLRAARDQIVLGLAAARAAAVQKGQTATLVFNTNTNTMRVALGADGLGQTIVGARSLKELYGASVTLATAADVLMAYDMRGFLAPSANRHVYRVQVNNLRDSVCVSRLGLTLKNGCLP